jgi:hypothetical protein
MLFTDIWPGDNASSVSTTRRLHTVLLDILRLSRVYLDCTPLTAAMMSSTRSLPPLRVSSWFIASAFLFTNASATCYTPPDLPELANSSVFKPCNTNPGAVSMCCNSPNNDLCCKLYSKMRELRLTFIDSARGLVPVRSCLL